MKDFEFQVNSREGVEWLASRRLGQLSWLAHAFSTRSDGLGPASGRDLNLGFTASDSRPRVEENRRRFLRALGGDFTLAALRQVHSVRIVRVTKRPDGTIEYGFPGVAGPARDPLPSGDALVTGESGILLSVRTADCLPILLVDARKKAVAAIHAGWRGALDRIIGKTVAELAAAFGSQPPELLAAIGPSIHACCYEVGEEVCDAYRKESRAADQFFSRSPGLRLDLAAVARAELQEVGVPSPNIETADFCTACRKDLFFSHRKEGPETGRMMAVVGMRSLPSQI